MTDSTSGGFHFSIHLGTYAYAEARLEMSKMRMEHFEAESFEENDFEFLNKKKERIVKCNS
jgi:hypothetical protein